MHVVLYTVNNDLIGTFYLRKYSVHRCWLSEENGTIWAFIGPMLLIIGVRYMLTFYKFIYTWIYCQVNTIFLIIAMYEVFKSKYSSMTTEKATKREAVK